MPQTLYSLRSEIDADGATHYRITKFIDGEVESSYITSREACECPAGQRPTCRHRQMLPQMLNADIVNTHWFYDYDRGGHVVDFEGTTRAAYERAAAEGEALRQAEATPFDQRSLGDALRAANIPGVTVVDLGDPAALQPGPMLIDIQGPANQLNEFVVVESEPTTAISPASHRPWRRL